MGRYKYLARALVKLMQIGKTPSRADRVLHHAPEAFDRIEVVATVGRQHRESSLAVGVVECGVELVRPMDPAAIDDPHDLCPGCAEAGHHLMEILAPDSTECSDKILTR